MTMNIFDETKIIESYRLDELLEARRNGKRICDFLPGITAGPTNQKALIVWKHHLSQKDCPWALTYHPSKGIYILWKIDETATDAEIRQIRNDPGQKWFKD